MSRFKIYYRLTKPGIIYGNSLTLLGGYFFASQLHVYWSLTGALFGSALVIASACVINNLIDRDIDARMKRTKQRASVTGKVATLPATIYAMTLGLIGLTLLATLTNMTTFIIGLIGYIDYIVFYGITKRRSIHGTLVGCISGATPILAGYTAVTSRFDITAFLLGLILVFWQLAHFYAIAMYRRDDYAAAGLPVLPVVKGNTVTKNYIFINIVGFMVCCLALGFTKQTNLLFSATLTAFSGYWLLKGVRNPLADAKPQWGKQMFLRSLVVILGLSVVLPASTLL